MSTSRDAPDAQTVLPNQHPMTIATPVHASRRWRVVELGVVVAFALGWVVLGQMLGAGISDLLPLGACLLLLVHVGVRREPLRAAFGRDRDALTRRWPGKALVAGVLVAIPAVMVFASLRAGRYADDSWTALLMVLFLTVGYLISGRLVLTVLVAGLVVSVTSWGFAPHLAAARNGDPTVLARLDQQAGMGMLAGQHDMAVAQIDLGASTQVRLAGLGADATTPMEVGSLTKAMTGLVVADAVRRGELRMDVPVETYLPALAGSPSGTVTMHELVTHTAGYVEFGAATLRRGAWKAPWGQNFLTTDVTQMAQEASDGDLATRGTFVYSSLGAATAGQVVAAAAGMSYPELMRARLFEPLSMTHTAIESDHALVAGGQSQTGLRVRPWIMNAYAPAGAVVSTTGDLVKLATALLDGTAPGMTALDPTTATGQSNTRIGDFWVTSTWQTGQTITWHDGQTGGYTSYLGLDRSHHKAVIVLSDVANPATTDVGIDLLAQHNP
jgi:CubicO group peptidase (beta-lactamase class C family)